jgi:hypothetical protein
VSWRHTRNRAMNSIKRAFGDPIIYQYGEGGTAKICAVFDSYDQQVGIGAEVEIDGEQFWLGIAKCDLKRKPNYQDRFTFDGVLYEVVAPVQELASEWRVRAMQVTAPKSLIRATII